MSTTIDLKRATISLRDGAATASSKAGAVNLTAGYTAGATVFVTDGFTGAVANGQTFTVVGATGTYTVVGHLETSSNTTSITFTPSLVGTVADNAVITVAALSGANILEVNVGEGNLTFTEKRNIEYRRNRGLLEGVREGDEEPVEVSFDFEWQYLKSSTGDPVTPSEVIKRNGNAAGWVSTDPDPCALYAIDILVLYHEPCGSVQDELIVLQDFRWETLDHNVKDGQISCKGNCNITQAISTRQDPVGDLPSLEDMMATAGLDRARPIAQTRVTPRVAAARPSVVNIK